MNPLTRVEELLGRRRPGRRSAFPRLTDGSRARASFRANPLTTLEWARGFAEPVGNGPLQDDMGRFHDGIYAVIFKVQDLDDAQRDLKRKSVKVTWSSPTAFVTDPETTHSVVMGFTTWEVPDDPRPDWTEWSEGFLPARLFVAFDAPVSGT